MQAKEGKIMAQEIALQRRLLDVLEEFNMKLAALPEQIAQFEESATLIRHAACVKGVWGQVNIDTGRVCQRTLEKALVKSAWLNLYDGMNIKSLMSANDKKRFEQDLEQMTVFDMPAIKSTFGDYILDPYGSVIKGLAEVFGSLDQSFKSHEKMKIGVKGLPKRIILSGFGSHCYGYGWDRLKDVINALAAYQGKPLVEWAELHAIAKDENALLNEWVHYQPESYGREEKEITFPARGIRLRRYANGNGHVYFEPDTLRDVNKALSDYYGDVLPDCHEARPERAQSTAVSKDLQYFPTPIEVVERFLEDVYRMPDNPKILEPSCGCGRIMDGIRKKWPDAQVFGIEYDAGRAGEARAKGHNVMVTNFLETVPQPIYDYVFMNPPFYGKHYAKHVEHALKFLKPNGILKAILPITARTDHGLLDALWSDLPMGSFRESGTNINTTVLTVGR